MLLISSRFRVVVCIVTSLAVFLSVFGLSIDNALVADDWGFLYSVSKTETVRNLFHLLDFQTSWFVRPTQWFLTWLLHTCFELRVALYHLASVLLHLTNLVLLGFLVYRLLVDHNLRGGVSRPSCDLRIYTLRVQLAASRGSVLVFLYQ